MFRRVESTATIVRLDFEGASIEAAEGETVAAALLAGGISSVRETAVSAAPRAPYCLMGVCFDCLVDIDGMPNRQACMTIVRDGMRISRQRGARHLP